MTLLLLDGRRNVSHSFGHAPDLYLPTNALAALANIAPHATNLHAHAAQRLVGLFASIAKRYWRLIHRGARASEPAASAAAVSAATPLAPSAAAKQGVLVDLLRIVLEIVNVVFAAALPKNPELVYACLHRQECFEALRLHPALQDLMANLYQVGCGNPVKIMYLFTFETRVRVRRRKIGQDFPPIAI